MTIPIIMNFMKREIILLFPRYFVSTPDEINKITHGVSILMVCN